MLRKFRPFCHAKSVYDIDMNFFKKLGIKYLFVDLDNTLDSYRCYDPSQRARNLVKSLSDIGITTIIISNNRGHRVSTYANRLGVEFTHSMGKPFSRKLKALIESKGISKDEILMVGDQMITDMRCANGAGLRGVLTDKIVKEDQWTTHINRFFERPYRKHCMRKHKFKEWSEI